MLNYIVLHGRLTADPELKQTQSGVSMCTFTIAVDRSYKSGEDKITDFFNVIAWRGLGEMISKFFTKGKEIVLSGSRKWTDDDGKTRVSWTVQANNVDFCGSKADSKPSVDVNPENDPLTQFADTLSHQDFTESSDSDDDLPF